MVCSFCAVGTMIRAGDQVRPKSRVTDRKPGPVKVFPFGPVSSRSQTA